MKKTTAYLLDEAENGFVAWKSDQVAHSYMMSRVKRIQEVFQYLPKNNVSWKNSFLIAFSQLQQEYAA